MISPNYLDPMAEQSLVQYLILVLFMLGSQEIVKAKGRD